MYAIRSYYAHDDRGHRADTWVSDRDLTSNRTLNLGSTWFILLIDDHNGVILKAEPKSAWAANLFLLADDHGTHEIPAHVGCSLLDTHRGDVSKSEFWLPTSDTMVSEHRDDLY